MTGIGNKTRTVNSKEYNIPLTDSEGKTWNIVAYGISEISEAICRVDVSQVVGLFEDVSLDNLERPDGNIELLIGSDWCNLQPQVKQTVDNLQLMKNMFGYCLRGSHPCVKFIADGNVAKSHGKRSYHITSKFNIEDISFGKRAEIKSGLTKFFEIESLGTHCIPRCGSCKCGLCPEGNNNYSIKEGRELELISDGLVYSTDKKREQVISEICKSFLNMFSNLFNRINDLLNINLSY